MLCIELSAVNSSFKVYKNVKNILNFIIQLSMCSESVAGYVFLS